MIRKLTMITAAIVFALMAFQTTAMAAGGTADEAKAMVAKAAQLIKTEGNEKAYATFDDPAGGFVDRDLYVFVLDMQGTLLAHGGNKALIGKSVMSLKDLDGKAFVQEQLTTAQSNANGGWVDYSFTNPVTKKVARKSSFVEKVGEVVVGVGIYKD